MTDWKKIKEEYEAGGISLKALAEKHNVKLGTLKSRKSRESWFSEKVATSNHATPKKVAKKDAGEVAPVKPVIESSNLTEKQKIFCLNYLQSYNATKAYQQAYQCSYESASVNGSRLLSNTKINEELTRLKAQMQRDLYLEGLDITREFAKLAFANITDYIEFGTEQVQQYTIDGEPLIDTEGELVTYDRTFVRFKNHDEVDGSLIQEVKKGKDGISVKLYDKQKALNELAKRLLSTDELKIEMLKAQIEALKKSTQDIGSQESEVAKMLRKMAGEDR